MAAGATYEPIATTTLSSAAASITFSSIPSTYTDLRLVLTVNTTSTSTVPRMRFNSSTSDYSANLLYGNGTSANADNYWGGSAQLYPGYFATTSTTLPTLYTIDIMSYAGSTYKTCLMSASADKNGSGQTEVSVGLWANTSAITSIAFSLASTYTYGTGTTATLYGIKSA